ncbi:hypothetical protein DOTSEDRAFT_74979 [Dothistroma septosporum NZE10]|uniref:Zn(2)-C6 fungal-type domain-containing protein n=1 Tax=Dothistroma septosporum (strain NZE10 / CBS 128990) TaxID=675120 RepID=N1PE22_DOTSN|nr:hypothetical protein DOTSEDRAFT_74979 [Dothistroma septosporum NZE10]
MDSWLYSPAAGSSGGSSNARASADGLGDATYSPIQLGVYRDSASPDEAKNVNKAAAQHAPRIRRRNRQITSCLECRRRKLKCDKQAPCTNCTRFRRDCLYLAPALDPSAQQKLADIKEKMGALEKNLEREVAAKTQKAHLGGVNVARLTGDEIRQHHEAEEEEDDVNEDEDALEPTPLASLDNVYEDNVDDELMDLGVQMGKMRISERIGGWIRPKLVEELNDTLEDVKAGKSRYSSPPTASDHLDLRPGAPKLQASPKSYIGPGPDYIAPASSFFFPGTNMSASLIDYLPSRNAADQLINQYWTAVHYMCRAVHRPTFEAQYTLFWGQITTGCEPVASVQAIIFSAMFSAAVSMTTEQIMQRFGTTKSALVDNLRSGAETALAKANFLRTTRVDTMQAFVMYLIPLVRSEVSRGHSALVGTAIRLAECMGLHRDGSYYNMTPIETHVRRMVWHQLCFLDMRTCEATGPRPQIRKEDYDTKMPLNVDDLDLLHPEPPKEDKLYWTDMTFMRIRAECQEMRRQVWYDIVALDKKKKSLTSILVKVQKFRASMEDRYLSMIDDTVPFQRFGRLLFEMHTKSLHLQVLHRYLFSTTQRMPDRLRQVLIEAGLCQMESSIAYETDSEMQAWTWYRGAFNQYHAALLLMVEVYAYPMRKEAARVWKCLDYIFEIPAHLAPKQKAELVLTDLRDRMEVYHQMRKVKVSKQMESRVSGNKIGLYQRADVMLDEMGQMQQNPAAQAAGAGTLPPAHFSPPPPKTNSDTSSSRQDSTSGGPPDVQIGTMEDIDWVEWEKVFNPEHYTGDLNLPDFNMTDFTGDYSANSAGMDPTAFRVTAAANIHNIGITQTEPLNMPTEAELADVHFTPTMIPNLRAAQMPGNPYQRQYPRYSQG